MGMITINRGISPSQAANRLGTSARRGPIGGDAVVTTGNRILEEALRCAARGWPVFPLHSVRDGRCSCNKPDCRDTGKHPLTAPRRTRIKSGTGGNAATPSRTSGANGPPSRLLRR
jgi:hypothetical protein